MCEAVVLKEMIEIGAPGGQVERDEGGAGAKQAGGAGQFSQLCKIRGVVEFVLVGSARIWDPLFFDGVSGLGGSGLRGTSTKVYILPSPECPSIN